MGSASQDRIVDVLVEIPRGSRTKYELESNKAADVKGWHDADAAWNLIDQARALPRDRR